MISLDDFKDPKIFGEFTSAHPILCMNSLGVSNFVVNWCVRTRSCSLAPGDCWAKPAPAADIEESRAAISEEAIRVISLVGDGRYGASANVFSIKLKKEISTYLPLLVATIHI